MEFSEAKALDIAKQFNVPYKTVRVWKHRGIIPDKYMRGNFVNDKSSDLTKAEKLQMERLKRFITTDTRIRLNVITELAGLNNNILRDFVRKGIDLKPSVLKRVILVLKKEILEVKILLKDRDILKLLNYPIFYMTAVLRRDADASFYDRILGYKLGRVICLEDREKELVRSYYYQVLLEISRIF